MRKTQKWLAIAVIIAVIGLALTACDNDTPDPCANGHDFPEWAAPTCTVDGNNIRTCTRCTQTDTRTAGFNALGCEGEDVIPATCVAAGFSGTGNCIRCEEPVTGTEIPKDPEAHDWIDNWTKKTDATCTAAQRDERECNRVGCTVKQEQNSTTVLALNHAFGDNWVAIEEKEAGWHDDDEDECKPGEEILTCIRCPAISGTPRPVPCKGTQALVIVGGVVMDDPANKTLAVVCIPDERDGNPVTEIAARAFAASPNNTTLTSVRIGANVTSINSQAFSRCINLTNVTIPTSVTYIRGFAFESCTSLTNMTIPANVIFMGDGVFYVCTSLETLTVLPTEPPEIESCEGGQSIIGYNINVNFTIFVVAGSVQAYKEADGWNKYTIHAIGCDAECEDACE